MSTTPQFSRGLAPTHGHVPRWEFHFVGSREIRNQFRQRLAQGSQGFWSRVRMVFSPRRQEDFSRSARSIVNEMLAEYAAQGWELVSVVPYQMYGRRIGFEWYFKRPVMVDSATR